MDKFCPVTMLLAHFWEGRGETLLVTFQMISRFCGQQMVFVQNSTLFHDCFSLQAYVILSMIFEFSLLQHAQLEFDFFLLRGGGAFLHSFFSLTWWIHVAKSANASTFVYLAFGAVWHFPATCCFHHMGHLVYDSIITILCSAVSFSSDAYKAFWSGVA